VFIKRDEKAVMVISERGEALIKYDAITNRYRYRVIRGDDPMEYDLVPSWMSEEELLRRTITSPYPDGVETLNCSFLYSFCIILFLALCL